MMNILTINQLRERKYSSELKIEEQIKDEEKFSSYIASYDSDGLKIYGYLVAPKLVTSNKAQVTRNQLVIFCHGRIEPSEYRPERQYAKHCEYLAQKGFVVFKPDYRGHGKSEGQVETIFESGYAIDVLNAIEALKNYSLSEQQGVEGLPYLGIMGHSLGGNIALKVMEVMPEIKAGVIWGGVSITADEMVKKWFSDDTRKSVAESLIKQYGTPSENPEFWKSISPINFVEYIKASILIQHGEKDESISTSQAIQLEQALTKAGKNVELILYKNGNHNFGVAKISRSPYNFEGEIYDEAIQKAAEFFKKLL